MNGMIPRSLQINFWAEFKGMFLTACQFPKQPHLMAILKRTTVVIAGHHAVYVRLHSEHTEEPILRFARGGITEDWLQSKNKREHGLYKLGVQQKYRDYDLKIEEERALAASMLASPEEKRYIERAALHEHWCAEAGVRPASLVADQGAGSIDDAPIQAPFTPQSPPHSDERDRPEASTPASFQIKEELLHSPECKHARTFGVIDVDAEENIFEENRTIPKVSPNR